MTPHDYDVFLSYNTADEEAVERLPLRLRDEGLRVFFAPWSVVPGEPWQETLEDALDRSGACAVCLGPAGLSPWHNEEMRSALQTAVETPGFRVIPVLLPGANPADANTLPRFLSCRTWVDFRPGLEDEAAFHRLRCSVLGIPPGDVTGGTTEIDPDAIPPVRPLPPGSVMPLGPNPHFTGRQEELRELAWLLEPTGTVAAIGLGGIGKTQLAVEYAHRYGGRYPDALARLETLGLVTLEADGSVRLHRLLSEFARQPPPPGGEGRGGGGERPEVRALTTSLPWPTPCKVPPTRSTCPACPAA